MYKFRIKDNFIFRDKINSDKIIIDSEPIIDKETLLQALAQWTRVEPAKSGNEIIWSLFNAIDNQHCRTNPTDDCPNCPRYKDDCEGLDQHEPSLTELQRDMRDGKVKSACESCKHKVMNYLGYESCEKWDCTYEPKETMPELEKIGKDFDKFCENTERK